MCLIIYSPVGHTPPLNHIEAAIKDNPDGVGIMSKYTVEKHLTVDVNALHGILTAMHEVEYAIHFRMATHGKIDEANTHPYPLANGGWLMHNGVLHTGNLKDKTKSDTWHYINDHLDPMLTHPQLKPDWTWALVGDQIGLDNKFVIMQPDGEFIIINENTGSYIDGAWYSNTYSLASYAYWRDDQPDMDYSKFDVHDLIVMLKDIMPQFAKDYYGMATPASYFTDYTINNITDFFASLPTAPLANMKSSKGKRLSKVPQCKQNVTTKANRNSAISYPHLTL